MDDLDGAVRYVEAVLRRWDPIGVGPGSGPADGPADEYDTYAPEIVSLLRRGANADDLEGYLTDVRTQRMGLPRVLGADRAVAAELADWWSSNAMS
jgi:hypothetical protein